MKKFFILFLILLTFTSAVFAEKESPVPNVPNPWIETTFEEVFSTLGLIFNCPTEAENVLFRILANESLAEMQFSLLQTDYVFRIQPAAEFTDISGTYYEWTNEAGVLVGWCDAVLKTYIGDTENTRVLLWFDAAPGIMYSLACVNTAEADLCTVAQSIYLPLQGECESDLPLETSTHAEAIG